MYRLPALLEAVKRQEIVANVEGEKDADALHALGIVATTSPGGAQKKGKGRPKKTKWLPEYSEFFRDADVILVPDNDDAGFDYVNIVGAALTGIAKRIRVLVPPGPPDRKKGYDTSDWIEAGGTAQQWWELVEAAPDWMAPVLPETNASAVDDAEKAKANAAEQALIDELARLPRLEYDRRRNEAADRLGVRRSSLDEAREARRAEREAEDGPAPLYGHWVVEPWPEEVDGDALILALTLRIRRHVVLSDEQALAVVLWILMAWVHKEVCVHSPYLLATSAEANSGKSTLAGLLVFLIPRGLSTVGITEAALFRGIELWDPSLVIDEADTVLVENEALRAVINSGWTRGSGVVRCIGDNNEPHLFPTFCPKVIAMKGRRLPDTTLSPLRHHRAQAAEAQREGQAVRAHRRRRAQGPASAGIEVGRRQRRGTQGRHAENAGRVRQPPGRQLAGPIRNRRPGRLRG
jgi:hypothetical protein